MTRRQAVAAVLLLALVAIALVGFGSAAVIDSLTGAQHSAYSVGGGDHHP